MNLYDFAPYYQDVYIILMLIVTMIYATRIYNSRYSLVIAKINPIEALFTCFFLIIFLGLRPIHPVFMDTTGYADYYEYIKDVPRFDLLGNRDIGFDYFRFICSRFLPVEGFFLLCEFLYITPIILACIHINNKSYPILLLAIAGSFSFYGATINVIRMGIASSFSILAFSLLIDERKKHYITAFLLFFLAFRTQASIVLPIASFIVTYFYLYKHPNLLFYAWILSIPISLNYHTFFENLFISLGFDDRLEENINAQYDQFAYEGFAHSGFRWDFLIYSAGGVLWSRYLIFSRKIKDKPFIALVGTYILANAFWILVIRAKFSDRFAGLSWYLYPIILIYPLLKYRVWEDNQKYLTIFIFCINFLFTFLMHYIYYEDF